MRRRPVPRSLAIAALALGCDRPAPPAPHDTSPRPEPSSTVVVAPPADPKILAALRDGAVTDASYARRTLYSWTTREQAQVLRAKKVFLLPTVLPSGPTPYVTRLEEIAARTGVDAEVARALLLHPSLRLRRYAWTRPWATRLPLADHDYGDQLLEIVLDADALVARFDPDRPDVFEVQDLDGRTVPTSELLADPRRLAAVFHVRTGADTTIPHREYVLCNESKIHHWSLATPETAAAIAQDRAMLAALTPSPSALGARASWHEPAEDIPSLFAQSVAFDDAKYRPTAENLHAIDDALAKVVPVGLPLVVVPSAQFAADAVVPNVPLRRPSARVRPVV